MTDSTSTSEKATKTVATADKSSGIMPQIHHHNGDPLLVHCSENVAISFGE